MRLKEALAKAGKIDPSKVGRGRPSAQMVEWGKELVAQGWTIEGFAATPTKVADKSDAPAKVKHTPTTNAGKEIADIGDPIHPLHTWTPVVMVDGKKVPNPLGPKTVCNNCSCSLPWCPCPTPIVNVDWNVTGMVEWRLANN